ncbi:MAG: bifunctional methylenetetrahydrofolate dehydrogenase/methenyltetrahydrofolate cyclohydrolase FolD [Alphaproteobacteria bacterium]|nr:bifunctional methylenetetrahydrofolate dehydrogenase/methenyltetrahydrofolate cyclohydrolase FolD [Alphaproteobacteria bacterium]
MTHIIDGKASAQKALDTIKDTIAGSKSTPCLAVILVGDDPASHVYVSHKIKTCEKLGIKSVEKRLPANVTEQALKTLIHKLNNDHAVHGILLQLPLPDHLNDNLLIQEISPAKDVDGLTSENIGKLVTGLDCFIPCTPQGCQILLQETLGDMTGKHAVIIGRSLLFGKPMAQLMLQENCTVTMAHSKTKDLSDICRQADILIAAVGREKMVKKEWVKHGACVIDVGINRMENGKLCGDVDFENVKDVCSAITPVPGGVGPMTIACLMKNTLKAYQKQLRN